MMRELILALVGGIGVGVLFGAIKVPIPGPASLSGVLGAIGLYTGMQLFILISDLIKWAPKG